jgi:transposase
MIEDRFVLSDGVWDMIAPFLPGKPGDRGVTASDNRRFLEAVLWRVRTGSPWRDLPEALGNWNSTFRRFRRWANAGVFESLFNALSGEPDFEYALIDGTIVSVHQKATGAKGGLSLRPSGGPEVD